MLSFRNFIVLVIFSLIFFFFWKKKLIESLGGDQFCLIEQKFTKGKNQCKLLINISHHRLKYPVLSRHVYFPWDIYINKVWHSTLIHFFFLKKIECTCKLFLWIFASYLCYWTKSCLSFEYDPTYEFNQYFLEKMWISLDIYDVLRVTIHVISF